MTDVSAIHEAFLADRIAAEADYLGRVLTVEGIVLRAGESRYSTPAIEASGIRGDALEAVFVLPFGHEIDASFRRLRGIRPGQRISVTGECRMISEPGGVLVFKECRIAQ